MNRSLVAVAVVLMTMLTPTTALAWFGWLDAMSGPGPYWGLLFEARVKCFGPTLPRQPLEEAFARLNAAVARDSAPGLVIDESYVRQWGDVVTAFSNVRKDFASRMGVTAPTQLVFPVPNVLKAPESQSFAVQAPVQQVPRVVLEQQILLHKFAVQQELLEIDILRTQLLQFASVGVIYSLCPDDMFRRWSVDGAVDLWWAKESNVAFGGGGAVRLTQTRAQVSYAVIPTPSRSVLDVAAGVGFYAFSSRGFSAEIDGAFFDTRFYLHAPVTWSAPSAPWWRQVLAKPVFTMGLQKYPEFEENIFGSNERLGGEWITSWGIFVNINLPQRRTYKLVPLPGMKP